MRLISIHEVPERTMIFDKVVSTVFSSCIVVFLFLQQQDGYVEAYRVLISEELHDNGPCRRDQFRCFNDVCIDRKKRCDQVTHCYDNSDETYCFRTQVNRDSDCPQNYPSVMCQDGRRCIPKIWKCDGVNDCLDRSDEIKCAPVATNFVEKVSGVINAQKSAVKWLKTKRSVEKTSGKWGNQVSRIAVALYLADSKFFSPGNVTGEELAYELSIQLLASHLRDETEKLSPSELALYVHATLVTCLNPRNLRGVDFVAILRQRVDAQTNYTNPFVLLTLCNTKDTMTAKDVEKLTVLIKATHRPSMTDSQALALMALSCISQKTDLKVEPSLITELASELKQRQYRNGSIETLHTTALVMQALFASGQDEKEDWDMETAVKYLVGSQSSDGSFGNLLNTYYILPVLKYKSLLNVNSDHCQSHDEEDEISALVDLRNQLRSKIHIKYSLWFGDEVDVVRTLELRTVANSTFFDIMNMAATIDTRFSFSYTTLKSKPYVYAVSGIQDEPEIDKYWFLYKLSKVEKSVKTINSSPVDVIPEDRDEYIMWYKSGEWTEE